MSKRDTECLQWAPSRSLAGMNLSKPGINELMSRPGMNLSEVASESLEVGEKYTRVLL